jgi:hypothetical protein
MPAYPGNNLAQLLYENRQGLFFNAEAVPAGAASVAFELRRERGAAYPWGFSVQAVFAGDPGAFEIDIEVSDIDVDSAYVLLDKIVAVGAGFSGRYSTTTEWTKFVRVRMVTLTNAVNATVMVTR